MAEYLSGLDIGTTGVKFMITDTGGNIVALTYREYPCVFSYPGWVEQDVDVVWDKICEVTREGFSKFNIDPGSVKSLGISSQRGTFIPVDQDIRPLMNSIVWSDGRADGYVPWLDDTMGAGVYHKISGVPASGLWAYLKMKWFIDNRKSLFDRTFKILNGQEYFLHKLGAGELKTDPASLTLNGMLAIDKLDWSEELCRHIGLPMDKLPPVSTPARQVGVLSKKAAEQTGFTKGMPIAAGAGDQQCAAIGAGIVREGMAEITIGTAMVMVAHIDSRKDDPGNLVLMGGSGIPHKWDMEGLQFSAGATLRWWRDTYAQAESQAASSLGLDVYDLITLEASQSPVGCKGHLFFPFFQGQSTPTYHDQARGGALGLSFIHDRKDMARSVLEGVTFETNMVIEAMEKVLGKEFDIIRLSGGGSKSDLWNHIQADIYGRTVERLRVSECTTLGAAILGAAGCGVFGSVEEGVQEMVHPFDHIEPNAKNHELYTEQYALFTSAYHALREKRIYERLAGFQRKYWG